MSRGFVPVLFALVALSSVAIADNPPASVPASPPVQFDIGLFGAGASITPTTDELTAAEEAQLTKLAPSIFANFGGYLESGCQNRAHAAYLLLPPSLRAKAMKIWLLSPGVYSIGFLGLIDLKGEQADRKAVHWGFHVALAFRSKRRGLMIFDGGLAPNRALNLAGWFAEMKIPALSLWTLTRPDVYQFLDWNVDPNNALVPMNPRVWSGRYKQDIPPNAVDRDFLISALARDSIGADALANKTCDALHALLPDPDALQSALSGPVYAGCEASFKRYQDERARLKKLNL